MIETLTSQTQTAMMAHATSQIDQMRGRIEKETTNVDNFDAIEAAAKDFEAVFLTEMIKPMFAEIKPNPLFGGGKGEEIFNGFLLQEYGKLMTETGGVGITDHVKAEMIRIQQENQ